MKLNLRNLQREKEEPKEEPKEKEEVKEEQEQDEEELGALEKKGERPDPIESPSTGRQLKKLKTHVVKRDVVADRGAAAMD